MNFISYKKAGTAFLAALTFSACMLPHAALAASSANQTNDTAIADDLANDDIIDMSKTGSLTIYKYDLTAAEAALDYTAGEIKATGEPDKNIEEALSDYALEGVQFSYLRVGDIETHSIGEGTASSIELVYEIPEGLASILGLGEAEAVDMGSENEANPCTREGVLHFTSRQLNEALETLITADNVAAKNALECYVYDYGTMDSTADQSKAYGVVNMQKTDESGYTYAENLELGLYILVETEVPENVTETVSPWFVSMPFTDFYGEKWLYDMTCYPKNTSGNPTLDKSVRNAYSNTVSESENTSGTDKNGTVHSGGDYSGKNNSTSLIVYNDDTGAQNAADTDDAAYVANRGGYTADGTGAGAGGAGYSIDFTYGDTTTASEGDLLDYILVSKLPHISSSATYLSEYTFADTLSAGISYNGDVKIAIYDNADDANANNTANAIMLWKISEDGNYTQEYARVTYTDKWDGKKRSDGATKLTVSMTEAGLSIINGTSDADSAEMANTSGLSDYYMVVYYTATVNSDESAVLGDEGNPNDVTLIWSRTSDGYYNMLEDRNYVYTYRIDLNKVFSDEKGDFSNVEFKLYNSTDAYYVVASKESDGIYYVTGKTLKEEDGTGFIPNAEDGSLLINGLEADEYLLSEIATDTGYSLLKDPIDINIFSADRDVIAGVAGVTGMDADAAKAIASAYAGGIYDENGNLVTSSINELTKESANYPRVETADGNEIGATDMYVGPLASGSATVDGVVSDMISVVTAAGEATAESENAAVRLFVTNEKNFLLPKTGSKSLYVLPLLGAAAAAVGCAPAFRRKDSSVKSLKPNRFKRKV